MYDEAQRVSYTDQTKAKQDSALGALDGQLDQMEKCLAVLQERLAPVLSQYAEPDKTMAVPHEEPASQLRARVERLRSLNEQVFRLTDRLDI